MRKLIYFSGGVVLALSVVSAAVAVALWNDWVFQSEMEAATMGGDSDE